MLGSRTPYHILVLVKLERDTKVTGKIKVLNPKENASEHLNEKMDIKHHDVKVILKKENIKYLDEEIDDNTDIKKIALKEENNELFDEKMDFKYRDINEIILKEENIDGK